MILSTTETVPGREILQIVGLPRGNVIRAKHIGSDLVAALRSLVGGEISEYTKLLAEAREQALDRMIKDAMSLNADAVVNVRFATSMVMSGAAEILVYGTAVRLRG